MISVHELTVSYNGALAVNEASFSAGPGSITSVVGRNGAGKTSMLRAVAGAVPMSHGEVSLNGTKLPNRAGEIARLGVRFVPESRNVFGDLSVQDNLASGVLNFPRQQAQQAVDRVLDQFSILRPLLSRKAKLLSGGERQSLAVARALVSDPSVLLLDEPSLGLSAKWAAELLGLIAEIADRQQLIVIVAEQNAALAARYSTELVTLETGVVTGRRDPADVAARDGLLAQLDG